MVEGRKHGIETRRRRKADRTQFQMNLQCVIELENAYTLYVRIYTGIMALLKIGIS